MNAQHLDPHLSTISTLWTVLQQAHQGPADEAKRAQEQLLQRYAPAVYRYLLGALHNQDAADEVFQEFALKFVRGDCKRVDPDKGQFRHFLKTVLYRLVIDYHRRQKKDALPLVEDITAPVCEAEEPAGDDPQFLADWRTELLNLTWDALAKEEQQSGQPYHTVLRCRADHPDVPAEQLAEQLAPRLGKVVSTNWIRKRLHRARQRFTELLLDEIARTLDNPTHEDLTQEVIELGLLDYCRTALERLGAC